VAPMLDARRLTVHRSEGVTPEVEDSRFVNQDLRNSLARPAFGPWGARPFRGVEHGRLRFVLPDRLGHVELVGDVDPEDVRAALVD